jgi:hypothetical protein
LSSPGTNPDEAARRGLVLEATITAAAVGVRFLLVGDFNPRPSEAAVAGYPVDPHG